MAEPAPFRVGVDFDNTLVCYDRLFHVCARERGLVPADVPATKRAVRNHLWSLPDGNTPWTELQSEVYGRRILEAEPFTGARRFLERCREAGIGVSVISHKDTYPALGEKTNLRDAARRWLEGQGFAALLAGAFFEDSREDKIRRIRAEGCNCFVDDLAELFADPSFPADVDRVLFAPAGAEEAVASVCVCRTWDEVGNHIDAIRRERLSHAGSASRR